jgi:hypothetical protein
MMSEMKHTPGPWQWHKLDGRDDPDHFNALESEGGTVLTYQVTCSDPNPDTTIEVSEANARLIASGPDLLAAAQAALTYLDSFAVSTGAGYDAARANLKAAIAKATNNAN